MRMLRFKTIFYHRIFSNEMKKGRRKRRRRRRTIRYVTPLVLIAGA